MLRQTVAVLPYSQSGTDEYGNPAESWGPAVVYAPGTANGGVALQHVDSEEMTTQRNVQVGDWLLVLHPHATIGGRDRVEADGSTFEVIGPPQLLRDIRGRPHHWEARLQHVEF